MESTTYQTATYDPIFPHIAFAVEIIRHYLLSIIILIGIIANIVSIVIFIRCRHKDTASIVYLTLLSVSDLGNLVIYTVFYWIDDGLKEITKGQFYLSIRDTSHYGCKLLRFIFDICRFLSAWTIVAFSVERCICVWAPLRSLHVLTKKRRILTTITLVILAILTNIPVLTHFGMIERMTGGEIDLECWYDLEGESEAIATLFGFGNVTVKNYLAPCILILGLNIAIVTGIMRNRRGKFLKKQDSKKTQELKATVNLLLVSTLYFILNMPFVVTWSMLEFSDRTSAVTKYLYSFAYFSTCLTVINYCSNLPVYCKSLDYYWAEFLVIFPFLKSKKSREKNQDASLDTAVSVVQSEGQ